MTNPLSRLASNSDGSLDRRQLFGRAGSLAAAFSLTPSVWGRLLADVRPAPLDFEAVPRSFGDEIVLPEGYDH